MSFPPHLLQRIPPSAPPASVAIPPSALSQLHTIAQDLRTPSPRIPTTALLLACDRNSANLAAGSLALSLNRDLLRIGLAALTSRSIRETKEDLHELFHSVDPSSSILFFDEADALFGKRTDVQDSHDRFRRLGLQDLLQQLQAFPGLSLLACTSVTTVIPGQLIRYTVHLPSFGALPPLPR